jgi:hypothetical protein
VPVTIPFCSEDELQADGSTLTVCPLEKFKTLIGETLKHECVADSLRPFVDSLNGNGSGGDKPSAAGTALHVLLWMLFAVLIVVFFAVVARHLLERSRSRNGNASKQEYGTLPQVAAEVEE